MKNERTTVMRRNLRTTAIVGLLLSSVGYGVYEYTEYQRELDWERRGYNRPERYEEEEGMEEKDRSWTKEEAQSFYARYKQVKNTLEEYNAPRDGVEAGGGATHANGQLSGIWKSRGPYNMPGAFQFCEMDEGTDTVYTVTCGHYGGVQFIWKGTLKGDDWEIITPKNPARYDDLIVLPNGNNRRVIAGKQGGNIMYSDNAGTTIG